MCRPAQRSPRTCRTGPENDERASAHAKTLNHEQPDARIRLVDRPGNFTWLSHGWEIGSPLADPALPPNRSAPRIPSEPAPAHPADADTPARIQPNSSTQSRQSRPAASASSTSPSIDQRVRARPRRSAPRRPPRPERSGPARSRVTGTGRALGCQACRASSPVKASRPRRPSARTRSRTTAISASLSEVRPPTVWPRLGRGRDDRDQQPIQAERGDGAEVGWWRRDQPPRPRAAGEWPRLACPSSPGNGDAARSRRWSMGST